MEVRIRNLSTDLYLKASRGRLVTQSREEDSSTIWKLLFADNIVMIVSVSSGFELYLSASNERHRRGRNLVLQLPRRIHGSSLEWYPIPLGNHLLLKTLYNRIGFLCGSSGVSDDNTVTVFSPRLPLHMPWVLWSIHPLPATALPSPLPPPPPPLQPADEVPSESNVESVLPKTEFPQLSEAVPPVTHLNKDSPPAKTNTPLVRPPKFDYATALFNMLSRDGPSENASEPSPSDEAWAGFQFAQSTIATDKSTTKPGESKPQPATGIEDLLSDSPPVLLPTTAPQKPQSNPKSDIMSLFEKQALLMAADKSGVVPSPIPMKSHQAGVSAPYAADGNFSAQNWPNVAYWIPGMNPMGVQNGVSFVQQGNIKLEHLPGSCSSFPTYGLYPPATTNNGVNDGTIASPSAPAPSSITANRLGSNFNFWS